MLSQLGGKIDAGFKEENGNPFQNSCLGNTVDGGA